MTQATRYGGLGFSYKWNMGWMHDTLRYMQHDPLWRSHDHHDVTFGLLYAFYERFVLPLSHDEVVYGKGSLIGRMPGDTWQRFRQPARVFRLHVAAAPARSCCSMGGEFGQDWEWNHDGQLDWPALEHPLHRGVQHLIGDLNRLYRDEPALHRLDHDGEGFRWLVVDDNANSVLAWSRSGGDGNHADHRGEQFHAGASSGIPRRRTESRRLTAKFSTPTQHCMAAAIWVTTAGSAPRRLHSHGLPYSLEVTLPPLATVLLRHAG